MHGQKLPTWCKTPDIQDDIMWRVTRAKALLRTLMALDECAAPEADVYATQHSILYDEVDAIAKMVE